MGNLYVVNAYLQSGGNQYKNRINTIEKLALRIPNHIKQTTILTVDFNFVEHKEDRINLASMEHTGDSDSNEARQFKSILLNPHKLAAVHQPHYTHRTPFSAATWTGST